MRILVAGAGPGGLTAALALRHAGHEVVVLERSPELRTAGAGLVVQPNALRMLARLGLAEAVAATGLVLEHGRIEQHTGRLLGATEMTGHAARFGQPAVAVVRRALSEALAARLPPGSLRFGAEVTGVSQDAGGVAVETTGGTVEGEALVGADGIHSPVRAAVLGPRPLRYAGYTCWRGIVDLDAPAGPATVVERWGRGTRFGIVPVAPGQTYWFATENAPPDGQDGEDPVSELRARFAAYAAPVDAVLAATPPDDVLRNDIVDLAPLDRWTEGRVTLLGDAAHAMTPNMGQGAAQAIEDAVVLGACLEGATEPGPAFAAYEAARRPRARSFVDRSWSLGAMGQWENGLARWTRDLALRLTPTRVVDRQLAGVFGVAVPA